MKYLVSKTELKDDVFISFIISNLMERFLLGDLIIHIIIVDIYI